MSRSFIHDVYKRYHCIFIEYLIIIISKLLNSSDIVSVHKRVLTTWYIVILESHSSTNQIIGEDAKEKNILGHITR